MIDLTEATRKAYRAYCEAKRGAPMDEAHYTALFSKLEFDWMTSAVIAVLEYATEIEHLSS